MNTEQIEAAIDKVLRKRGASSHYARNLKRDLLAEITAAQKIDVIAEYQKAAEAMRWSVACSNLPSANTLGATEPEPAEKTYEIMLERDAGNRCWQATIVETSHHYRFVDKVYGKPTDGRAFVLKSAKLLIADLQVPKKVSVVVRDGWVRTVK